MPEVKVSRRRRGETPAIGGSGFFHREFRLVFTNSSLGENN
jgi:hypothetical protein